MVQNTDVRAAPGEERQKHGRPFRPHDVPRMAHEPHLIVEGEVFWVDDLEAVRPCDILYLVSIHHLAMKRRLACEEHLSARLLACTNLKVCTTVHLADEPLESLRR